jgi:mono/diheme cytochrome c family protein
MNTLFRILNSRDSGKPILHLLALCVVGLLTANAKAQSSTHAGETVAMTRGAYLTAVADCAACHTAGPAQFAGGLAINSPFGIIYSTNITPDPVAGIGRYSELDFSRAVREGVAKDGHRLYPAMPYASFAAMSEDDLKDIYRYFMHEVVAVNVRPKATNLSFPFNQRWGIKIWDILFADQSPYHLNGQHDREWNRGAYLVESLGHCGACHTSRGIAYQEKGYSSASSQFLNGEVLDNWYAPKLTGDRSSGLGRWSEADIVSFLKYGQSSQASAFGSMTSVIENSTQFMTNDDLLAIAKYLKSLPARREHSTFLPNAANVAITSSAILTGITEKPGVGLYLAACAKCHKADGLGEPTKFPKLAGSAVVLSDNATSLIRLVLEGSKTAHTVGTGKPNEMPGFSKKFSDRELADILSFIRSSWGNYAAPVTSRDVTILRKALAQ